MDSRDKFAQMLREGYEALDPEKEQREYIRELLRRKERQRKRRVRTITAVAAAFLIVVGTVLAVGGCFGAAEADKNDRTKVEEQDNSIIISDENADGQEVMPETAMTTEWDKIDKLKEKYPEMITFTDVPEGMQFVSVEVIETKKSSEVIYTYSKGTENVYVCQRKYSDLEQETQGVEKYNEYIEYNGTKIFIDNSCEISSAVVTIDNSNIDIIGELNKQMIFSILKEINKLHG